MTEPYIVEAVMASASTSGIGGNKALAARIEEAMSQAVLDASAEGITDPMIIKAWMLEARARVKAGE